MNRWDKHTAEPIHRYLLFLILRFAVFLLIAMAVYTSLESENFFIRWAALGYFALSEILLLIRSSRSIKQGIAIGIYFLDVYAVSSLILNQGLSIIWYLTIPVFMLGASLCYNRRGAWLPIALIPSVLILYQAYQMELFAPDMRWELIGIIFIFFVFAVVVYVVIKKTDRFLSLYLGHRKLFQGILNLTPSTSIKECMQLVLEKEPPIPVDLISILLFEKEGNMGGLERVHDGEISTVRLDRTSIPAVMSTIKKNGGYFPDLRKQQGENDYFPVRRVTTVLGEPFQISKIEGLILFGRVKSNDFTFTEREMLMTYSGAVSSWLRQSYFFEKLKGSQTAPEEEPIKKEVSQEIKEEHDVRGGMEGRLQVLEEENQQLKEELDEQVRVKTLELKQTITSLMERESELDQQVFDKLAAVELGQAVTMFFNLDLILDLILDVVCETLSVESASIMLLREKEGDLVVHSFRGLQDEIARKTRLLVGEAIAGYVAQKGEPLLIEDIEQDPRFVPFHRDRYRSGTLLSVPILHEGNVVGVINLADPKREGPFLPRDLEVLQALSRQAAIAISNHRLYQEFENGAWIRKTYEERLTRKLSEKVMQESQILEAVEGEYQVSILSVRFQEDDATRMRLGVTERVHRIEKYLQEIREVIVRHQGDVAGDTGTGMIGVFGLPFQDDRDPWRAVLAAVDLLKMFTRPVKKILSSETNGGGISVGVATGELLLRQKKGHIPYGVFGESWERALILMQAGSHGQILVDETTYERVAKHVHGLRLELPYGVNKKMTVYGIKGLKRMEAEARAVTQDRSERV